MWVTNPLKEQVKECLRRDIESLITDLTNERKRIHEMISLVYNTISGAITGEDQRMLDKCQGVLQEIMTSLQSSYVCLRYIEALDIRDWEDDEC